MRSISYGPGAPVRPRWACGNFGVGIEGWGTHGGQQQMGFGPPISTTPKQPSQLPHSGLQARP